MLMSHFIYVRYASNDIETITILFTNDFSFQFPGKYLRETINSKPLGQTSSAQRLLSQFV